MNQVLYSKRVEKEQRTYVIKVISYRFHVRSIHIGFGSVSSIQDKCFCMEAFFDFYSLIKSK